MIEDTIRELPLQSGPLSEPFGAFLADSPAPEAAPDIEWLSWWAEIEAELPEGDGLTEQECRADYLLQRVAEEEAARAHVMEFTAARVVMVREHGEREVSRHERRIMHLHARIAMNLPRDAAGFKERYGKKSVSLPHGDVGFSAGRESLTILDAALALAFAKANGLEVKVVETVGKTQIMAHLKATGELADGTELQPGTEKFYVKPRAV